MKLILASPAAGVTRVRVTRSQTPSKRDLFLGLPRTFPKPLAAFLQSFSAPILYMLIYFFILSNACGAERIMSKIVCVLLAFVSISHSLKAKRKLNVFLLFQSPISNQNQKCLAQYCARSQCCGGIVESISFLPHCIVVFLWYKYMLVLNTAEEVTNITYPILVLFDFHELSIEKQCLNENKV